MHLLFYLSLLTLAACSFACNGDFRERAKGDTREFVVVMDSVDWDSKTSYAPVSYTHLTLPTKA